jgi:hypothetical protein
MTKRAMDAGHRCSKLEGAREGSAGTRIKNYRKTRRAEGAVARGTN